MHDESGQSLDCTPEMALQKAFKSVKQKPADKAFIILLNDEGKGLVRYFNAGLTSLDGMGLLEVVKGMLLQEFNDITGDG